MPKTNEQSPQLNAIVVIFDLPHEGHLHVTYRLTKGPSADPKRQTACYGQNPDTKEIESHFSTDDKAVFEVTLTNVSHHHLKHVHLTGIRIVNEQGEPADKRLPDGNLLMEIVPEDSYFGDLAPHEHQTKHLSLVTRGVEPGSYAVKMKADYDIVQWTLPISLQLSVRPD